MRFFVRLLTVALSLLVAYGCASRGPQSPVGSPPLYKSPAVLSSGYQSLTYKGNISAFGKDISGLFFFKKVNEKDYRFVLMTEFGLSLMGFGISADSVQVLDCQEFINKPGLLSMIGQDMSTLLIVPKSTSGVKTRHRNGCELTKFKVDKRKYKLVADSTANRLTDIKIKQGWLGKSRYRMAYDTVAFPSQIRISHGLMPLKMKLNRLKIVD